MRHIGLYMGACVFWKPPNLHPKLGVPNNWVLRIWAILIVVQVLGQASDYAVLGPLGFGCLGRLTVLLVFRKYRGRHVDPKPKILTYYHAHVNTCTASP